MQEKPRPRGLFGGNRSLTIIFIDVLVILVIYAIYTFFLAGPTSSRTVDGYLFSVSARRLDGAALATLRVEAVSDAPPPENPIISVLFPGTDEAVKDVLPEADGPERVFQREIPVEEETDVVSLDIEALGRGFTLGAALDD